MRTLIRSNSNPQDKLLWYTSHAKVLWLTLRVNHIVLWNGNEEQQYHHSPHGGCGLKYSGGRVGILEALCQKCTVHLLFMQRLLLIHPDIVYLLSYNTCWNRALSLYHIEFIMRSLKPLSPRVHEVSRRPETTDYLLFYTLTCVIVALSVALECRVIDITRYLFRI